MTGTLRAASIGTPLLRIDGAAKVTGSATYAYEHPVHDPAYGHLLTSTVARGRITAIDTDRARSLDGVLAVLTHDNAERLADTEDAEMAILQTADVAYWGQVVAIVVAEDAETARQAAELVDVRYDVEAHELFLPEVGDGGAELEVDAETGDAETALRSAEHVVDAVYETPMEHNNPLEGHTTVATWNEAADAPRLTLHDSTQSVHTVRKTVATLFGLERDDVRVVAPHVGGGFGSKGTPHAQNTAAVLAARAVPGRTVKLALTRRQLFTVTGHRTPTRQRVRLGADRDGRLRAVVHESLERTARIKDFQEQSDGPTKVMYASPAVSTGHRLIRRDVPVPSWMRAPGEMPGMFALEVAMDELAVATGIDPVELRVRNEPAAHPVSGLPWSSRNLVACLREGAERFGWESGATPGTRRDGEWLVGHGVAASTYPMLSTPGSKAQIEHRAGRYAVRIGAVDLGTGAWTVLTQIAADALDCPVDCVDLEIGDTALPSASVAGGSSGTTSWGSTIVAAARAFREEHGETPPEGATTTAGMPENPAEDAYAIHSFGAHFVESRVSAVTGEVRVPRMLGVFSVGRIINPRTARSQLLGGMVWGLSAALHEEGVLDPASGAVLNRDLAQYHVAANADVADLEAVWLDEEDTLANPMGSKGIGEIGIVGSPAAVANAVHAATGVRFRSLPLTPDRVLTALEAH